MYQYRDLIARMAIDDEFAARTRAHPEEVARAYGLTPEESDKLRDLVDAGAGSMTLSSARGE